jgi:hypothetical protein
MDRYTPQDFVSYYGDSWFINPSTGSIVRILSLDDNRPNTHVKLSDKTSIPIRDLDWKHVVTPPLGYRCMENGRLLYYVSRRPLRGRPKGVTPQAIIVETPGIMSAIASKMGYEADVSRLCVLNEKMAKSLWEPEFMQLRAAVDLLTSKAHAVAAALNPNWAITIGLHEDKRFLLHYKNNRVGFSPDGKSFSFSDVDAQYIFDRSGIV